MRAITLVVALIASAALAAAPQGDAIRAADVVQANAYALLEPVPRGQNFEIAVVAHIHAGYHINAHKPTYDYMIPTEVLPAVPNGITLMGSVYPKGQELSFSFAPKEEFSVYTGDVVFRLRMLADDGVAVGPLDLPIQLQYQACSNSFCLPPVKIPVTVHLEIAPAGTKASPAHQDVLGTHPGKSR